MYKLVITRGKGPSRKVDGQEFWTTQSGLHQAEEAFERATLDPMVMKAVLWRVDINGVHDLKRWER